ncbi:MAG: YigZ family protein [Calditrichaeota bacterium]|nr:YigZ family protein [Calditrichota bacterium]
MSDKADKIGSADRYKVPSGEASAKITVKGSKFISHIFPAESKEEAETKYAQIKRRYHDATHNCFAYRIDEHTFRYSDDGEPSGTAGKPILQVLDSAGLFEVLCVVTRYFGGTKLGTGGLIRAYGDAAKEALNQLKIGEKIRTTIIALFVDYNQENLIFRLLHQWSGKLVNSEYGEKIKVRIELPQSTAQLFLKKLEDLSAGRIQILTEN